MVVDCIIRLTRYQDKAVFGEQKAYKTTKYGFLEELFGRQAKIVTI